MTSWVFRPMVPRLAVIYGEVMSSLPPEIDDQVAYSLDEARRYLSHGNKRRAADELQFAAERAVEPRHFSAIYQLAASSRKNSWRFGRGRWNRILETLDRRRADPRMGEQ